MKCISAMFSKGVLISILMGCYSSTALGNPIPRCDDVRVKDALLQSMTSRAVVNNRIFRLISQFKIVSTQYADQYIRRCFAELEFRYPDSYSGEDQRSAIVRSQYEIRLNEIRAGEFYITDNSNVFGVMTMHERESTYAERQKEMAEFVRLRKAREEEEARREQEKKEAELRRNNSLRSNPFDAFKK